MTPTLMEIIGIVIFAVVAIDALTGFKLIKSLFNRGRKGVEDLAEAARDPIADAQVAISDVEKDRTSMIELRRQVLTEVKLAESRKVKANSDITKYENLARLAGQAKNVNDVKSALEKKAVVEKELQMASNDVTRFQKQEDELETKIKECVSLLEKARSNTKYLATGLKYNKFKAKVNDTLVNAGGSAQSALARLEEDVEKSAAEASVSSELANENVSLEDKYSNKAAVTDADVAKYMS